MRTTIDRAGRVVIPAPLRDRVGFTPGSELDVNEDELGVRLTRVGTPPRLCEVGRGRADRQAGCGGAGGSRVGAGGGRRRGAGRGRAEPLAVSAFLDTSVLLAGLIDFGPQSAPAQMLLHAVAEKQVADPSTAWHCCLEFFS